MSSSGKDVEAIPKTVELKDLTTKCWSEIFAFFHSLRPEHPSTIALFESTPGFSPIVSDVLSPGEYSKVSYKDKPKLISKYKTRGLVYFPNESSIGKSPTILIPLYIGGTAWIDGRAVEADHYYHIFGPSNIVVSESGKLAAVVIIYG
ncbi:uncharacterized protein BDV17DRAFT_116614 [Aspergillus undulatus]|uniref:uncharacterized protein n=1 Tax=Aspergillus undulatus TaxID=1810928 RepID=UPI003CCE09DA